MLQTASQTSIQSHQDWVLGGRIEGVGMRVGAIRLAAIGGAFRTLQPTTSQLPSHPSPLRGKYKIRFLDHHGKAADSR